MESDPVLRFASLARSLPLTLTACALSVAGCGSAGSTPSADAASGTDAGITVDGGASSGADAASPTATTRFTAEAWADNWFAAYLGETLVKEDSVPITTERSFNAETFSFDATYPFTLAFILKDYKENDSGLEYIGKTNQQIGDGGFVLQLREATSRRLVLVTNASWKCLPIQRAPLNPSCEKDANPLATCMHESRAEPSGWKAATFDDGAWPAAQLFTAAEVGPKDGYTTIAWDPSAKFIWSSDLKIDNTVLCRVTVGAP